MACPAGCPHHDPRTGAPATRPAMLGRRASDKRSSPSRSRMERTRATSALLPASDEGPLVLSRVARLPDLRFARDVMAWLLRGSAQAGKHRRHATGVLLERPAESLAQKLLLAAHADDRAGTVQDDRRYDGDPVGEGQTGRQEHPEHPRVDLGGRRIIKKKKKKKKRA